MYYDFIEKWVPPIFIFIIALPLFIPFWILWWLAWVLTDIMVNLFVPFGSQGQIISKLKQSWFNPDSDKRDRARQRAEWDKLDR
jgi:hypothetical protein